MPNAVRAAGWTAALLALLIPVGARASVLATGEGDLGIDPFRIALAVLLCLLLAAALPFVLRRFGFGGVTARETRTLRLLESLRLDSRVTLYLIEVDGRRALIGVSPNDVVNLVESAAPSPALAKARDGG